LVRLGQAFQSVSAIMKASERLGILLHNTKGRLDYEQNSAILTLLEQGQASDALSIEWGPRMVAGLAEDPELVFDWLIEIGFLIPSGDGWKTNGV
jgi:hypothetical protein